VYTVSINGYKMIVDADGLPRADRERLLRLLGLLK